MTGFEPATTRPPAVYANRTAPHPEIRVAKITISFASASRKWNLFERTGIQYFDSALIMIWKYTKGGLLSPPF